MFPVGSVRILLSESSVRNECCEDLHRSISSAIPLCAGRNDRGLRSIRFDFRDLAPVQRDNTVRICGTDVPVLADATIHLYFRSISILFRPVCDTAWPPLRPRYLRPCETAAQST